MLLFTFPIGIEHLSNSVILMITMRKHLAIAVLLLFAATAMGQNSISGSIFGNDSSAVAGSSVELLQMPDSIVLLKTASDADGYYRFENLKKGSYLVRTSTLGGKPVAKKVMLWSNSNVEVNFKVDDTILMDEVKVLSTGIHISGDTTSYSVSRFTTGSEKNLKDVLEKLPNIQVDDKAKSITANGKKVSRILLEKQDLFQGNTSVPMDNLSADGIKQVDIIDNYSEFNIYDGFHTTNETVLNVGVSDKMKNKLKGEAEATGGVLNKYKAKNSSIYIGKKSMFSGIIASNNIGNSLLTFQDIMQFSGGLQNMLSGDDPMVRMTKLMETYSDFIVERKDINKAESSLASLNFIANPSKQLKISANGIYGYNDSKSRSEHDYNYLSGLQYSDTITESSRQHNALMNLKVQYMPSADFNIIYSNSLMFSDKKTDRNDMVYSNALNSQTKPRTTNVQGNLTIVKRFGKNVLNLILDYSLQNLRQNSFFSARSDYYLEMLNLSKQYDYSTKRKNNEYSANIFYMHRLNDDYYLRVAMKGRHESQKLNSWLTQSVENKWFDNDSRLQYNDYNADASLGKDRGKLTYEMRLRYSLLHANTNIDRKFVTSQSAMLSPMLKARYSFSMSHFLSLSWEYGAKENPILSLLANGYMSSYNHIATSSADRFFYKTNSISATHALMLQYLGLSIFNMLSFDDVKNGLTNNNSLFGLTNLTESRIGPDRKNLTARSFIQYRFLNVPLNVNASVNYTYAYMPVYNFNELFKAKSDNVTLMLQMTTRYKKGLNGQLQWTMSSSAFRGMPVNNSMHTHDVEGLVSWQNDKLYAGVNARANFYRQGNIHADNLYYGFDIRYDISKTMSLTLTGHDVLHLKERRQTIGQIDTYYSIVSRVWYMPGNILLGLKIKY